MAKKISGTREWAKYNLNIATGCEHGCRYCYARANAMRFKKIASPDQWLVPVLNEAEVNKGRGKRDGTIMFPTAHDITPALLRPSIEVLRKLCDAGNNVLVVSKPHPKCIMRLCQELAAHNHAGTDRILFRFTIGALDDEVLSYWEPHAPSFNERIDAIAEAWNHDFRTSVSIEPMLDAGHIEELVSVVQSYVSDSIWIGRMNHVRRRVIIETPEDEAAVRRIEDGQTDEQIKRIYNALKANPLIRWKESIKSVVGLPLATEAGEDA
jgi:DNA repair photolyase